MHLVLSLCSNSDLDWDPIKCKINIYKELKDKAKLSLKTILISECLNNTYFANIIVNDSVLKYCSKDDFQKYDSLKIDKHIALKL